MSMLSTPLLDPTADVHGTSHSSTPSSSPSPASSSSSSPSTSPSPSPPPNLNPKSSPIPPSDASTSSTSSSSLPIPAAMSRNRLTTFYGVFLPTIMSIYNVLMYIRFSWMVGCVGYLEVLVIFLLGSSISLLTTMSISAIATNGSVQGGGVYFVLSRTLGPSLGGAVGLTYYVANTISGNLSILGMLSPFIDAYNIKITDSGNWDVFIMGSIILASFTIVSLIGANFFTRLSTPLFLLSITAIISGLSGFFSSHANVSLNGGYTGWSWDTFKSNFLPPDHVVRDKETGDAATFAYVFSIFYPCVTGILAGVNMSGDLANPEKSIPRGTFSALGTAIATYWCFVTCAAFTIKPETLQTNYYVVQQLCFWNGLIIYALMLAGFQASMTGMMGSARVLQAVAKDGLLPGLHIFAKGTTVGDEPRHAIILTWAITQITLFITEVNSLAPIITQIFLLTYGFVNFTAFALKMVGVVNFRPSFQHHHWSLSLLGFLGCCATMIVCDYRWALAAMGVFTLIAIAIFIRDTSHIHWGELSQALMYHQTRKYLLKLEKGREHVKYWRPQIMLLCSSRVESLPLVAVANQLKKGGLYAVSSIIVQPSSHHDDDTLSSDTPASVTSYQHISRICSQHQDVWDRLLLGARMKAFPSIVPADSLLAGVRILLMSTGLGAMRPNTVMLRFPLHIPQQGSTSTSSTTTSTTAITSSPSLRSSTSPILSSTSPSLVATSTTSSTTPIPPIALPTVSLPPPLPASSSYRIKRVRFLDDEKRRTSSSRTPVTHSTENDPDDLVHQAPPQFCANHLMELDQLGSDLPYDQWNDPMHQPDNFVLMLLSALACHKNLIIGRHISQLHHHKKQRLTATKIHAKTMRTWNMTSHHPYVIEVWVDMHTWLGEQHDITIQQTMTFVLQMAHILSRSDEWKGKSEIRVIAITMGDVNTCRDTIQHLLNECRFNHITIHVIPLSVHERATSSHSSSSSSTSDLTAIPIHITSIPASTTLTPTSERLYADIMSDTSSDSSDEPDAKTYHSPSDRVIQAKHADVDDHDDGLSHGLSHVHTLPWSERCTLMGKIVTTLVSHTYTPHTHTDVTDAESTHISAHDDVRYTLGASPTHTTSITSNSTLSRTFIRDMIYTMDVSTYVAAHVMAPIVRFMGIPAPSIASSSSHISTTIIPSDAHTYVMGLSQLSSDGIPTFYLRGSETVVATAL